MAHKASRKKTILIRSLLCCFSLLTAVFIWLNSSRTGPASGEISTGIQNWLQVQGNVSISEYFIRKLGHIAEFALLGLLLLFTLRSFTNRLWAHLGWVLWAGLIVAVLDELLQRYVPGRSSDVRDILIDFTGLLIGIALGKLLLFLYKTVLAAKHSSR